MQQIRLAVRQLVEEVDRIHQANCALKVKHISGQFLCRCQNLLKVGGVAPAGALDEQIFQILLCHFGQPLIIIQSLLHGLKIFKIGFERIFLAHQLLRFFRLRPQIGVGRQRI